jgi:hypothetical protein
LNDDVCVIDKYKKLKKYGLKRLSKEEHIRRQIANAISLPLVPQNEINNFMEQIIDVLGNIDSKFDKFTDYVLKNYVEDARFTSDIWNHFDSIGVRSRTNNHLEGWHRQLNARVRTLVNVLTKRVRLASISTHITRASTQTISCV